MVNGELRECFFSADSILCKKKYSTIQITDTHPRIAATKSHNYSNVAILMLQPEVSSDNCSKLRNLSHA